MPRQKTIKQLKEEYIQYYTDVPIQKYAAMAVNRDEDTIIRWRKDDTKFADAVQRARAEWIRKRMLGTKAEFALERLEKEIFSPRSTVSIDTEQREPLVGAVLPNQNYFDYYTLCEELWRCDMEDSDMERFKNGARKLKESSSRSL